MKAKLFAIFLFLSVLSNFCMSANTSVIKSSPKINLNTATASDLTNVFKGIGEKRAQNIVKYRNEHGKFKDVAELANVKGIGKKFIAKNSSKLNNTFSLG